MRKFLGLFGAAAIVAVSLFIPTAKAEVPALYATKLAELTVVADGTVAPEPYVRSSAFGPAWADVDRNGCDTRNDILKRDLKNPVFRTGSDCVVESGQLNPEAYTGSLLVWKRGDQPGIDIDHMIPLKRAWDTGAYAWDYDTRLAYANDPMVLLAVSGSQNRSKSDQGPGTWMPPSTAFHCTYSKLYIDVAVKYDLSVTESDKTALDAGLDTCTTEDVTPDPTPTTPPTAEPTELTVIPTPTTEPTVTRAPGLPDTGW